MAANFFKLPVYKKALDLERQFTLSTQKAPRDVKYARLNAMHETVLQIIEDIAFANEFSIHRVEYINKALGELNGFIIRVRLLLDLRYISKKGFAAIVRAEEDVTRQLTGWRNSLEKTSGNNINNNQ